MWDSGAHAPSAESLCSWESLADARSCPAGATGVRVRETVPDTFLDRADDVINGDVTVEELRSRLREGTIYRPEDGSQH